jgi:kinesin family protein C2/C3
MKDTSLHLKFCCVLLPGNIRVYCRVRPFLPGQENSSTSVAGMEERTITIITPTKYGKDGSKSFTFNKVFGPVATQGYKLPFCTFSPN